MPAPISDQIFCVLDYETYSTVDLKKVGAFEYSVDPSTEILCIAFRVGTRKTLRDEPTYHIIPGSDCLTTFLTILADKRIMLVAHNAYFEQVITRNVLSQYTKEIYVDNAPPERWVCTAARAAALALPRSLTGAGAALGLDVQKDKEGAKLMLKMCKPRKPTRSNPSTRHDDPSDLKRLVQYCIRDVDTEVELFLKTPPLTPLERKVWCLDQRINLRGFMVDRPLVETTLKMIATETENINRATQALTLGVLNSATQRDGVLTWLEDNGGPKLSDLRKVTVEDAVKTADGSAKELLEHRLAISKTSTAKYEAFKARSRSDGRLRDILMYHAASTGRWSGLGVQPQNFPRGSIKDTLQACEILARGNLELIRLIYCDPMKVFSSCLRGMIIAPEGKTLDIADYNAIETRVLFWAAGHEEGLKAFREGRDLYSEMAAQVFNRPLEKILNPSFERNVGKGLILGAGYNMGGPKFATTCQAQGLVIDENFAAIAINRYRTVHAPVPRLWGAVGRAATAAIENPNKKFILNQISFSRSGDFLFCELPSGRRLAYHRPSVRYEVTPWGEKRPVIYHYGINLGQWREQKTYGGRLVENICQAIARDVMAEAMLRIESEGVWEIVLSVHDELIAERCLNELGTLENFCQLMAKNPAWAKDLPLAVSGFTSPRYKK